MMLGGTSSLNFLLFSEGHYRDYDHWAKITGDETWNWDRVLPYFIKAFRLEQKNTLSSFRELYYGSRGMLDLLKDTYEKIPTKSTKMLSKKLAMK